MIFLPRFTRKGKLCRCRVRMVSPGTFWLVKREQSPQGEVIRVWCCGFLLTAMVTDAA